MNYLALIRWLGIGQLLHRILHPVPHPASVHVAGFKQLVGTLGRMYPCTVSAVLFDQRVRGAVDVDVGNHHLDLRQPAAVTRQVIAATGLNRRAPRFSAFTE